MRPDTGQQIEPGVRSRLEQGFGRDFSDVRVHADSAAGDSARRLGAQAYTVGDDIHFAAGQYQPGTAAGGHLLAHELAHAAQQRGGPPSAQLKSAAVSQEGDAA